MKVVSVMTVEGFAEIEDEDEPTIEELNIALEELEADVDTFCESASSRYQNAVPEPRLRITIRRVQ